MHAKSSYHCFVDSIADGVDMLDFLDRVSNAIMSALHDPACNCPAEARSQWREMTQIERLSFVSAGLECFYWIYIARKSREKSISYPSWENATIDQQVETAAGFCSFLLGTEFEQDGRDSPPNSKFSPEWVN